MTTILETKKLTKTFNPKTHTAVAAVQEVDFQLKKGEIVMIMGPSGSGKTTFLTMIGGLLRPSSGQIIFNNQAIQSLPNHQLTKIRREKIGFIFQSFNLLDNLCAWENVYITVFNSKDRKDKAIRLLERLGLKNRLHAKPRDLSGGERQRVAIARALINDPLLILADEPTANLDKHIGHEVMQIFCSISCQEGKSIVIVSHDERIKDVAHRVIYIEDGRLILEEKGRHNQVCLMKKHHD